MAKKIVQMKELVSKNPDVYDDILPYGTFSGDFTQVTNSTIQLEFDTTYYICVNTRKSYGGEGGLLCFSAVVTTPSVASDSVGLRWYFPIGTFDSSILRATTVPALIVNNTVFLESSLISTTSTVVEATLYFKSTVIEISTEGLSTATYHKDAISGVEGTSIYYKKIQ